ncbi:MAG: DJ-1/PfpI family protein [Acidobacteria bacterium]|nr:DJ-1/PfpI family protein [Acidobacteriota bacterium]MCB9399417.1 DJ-1/PfpI family protein [Acidobacteriota bacterium]
MHRIFLFLIAGLGLWAQPIKTVFLVKNGVFNSELMAPFDILEHSRYRDPNTYFQCLLVSPDGKPIRTAEGLRLEVDLACNQITDLDVLVVPSTETSMDKDFEDAEYCRFVKEMGAKAKVVISLCDGAFALAHAGLLDGMNATTFPSDQKALAEKFPKIKVHEKVWFVQDGKFITSVGGARSYEPALYLTEQWMGRENATRSAQGLVITWPDPAIPFKAFGPFPPAPEKKP